MSATCPGTVGMGASICSASSFISVVLYLLSCTLKGQREMAVGVTLVAREKHPVVPDSEAVP